MAELNEMDSKLIADTFGRIGNQQRREYLVERFYDYFLAENTHITALFEDVDLKTQHQKLLLAFTLIAENADQPNVYRNMLTALGERHLTHYHVTVDMMPAFRTAFLAALRDMLGNDWTPQHAETWMHALNEIERIMFPAQ